jgi:hypothetical protein
MNIPEPWLPLLVSSVRDAVLYHEQLLTSETLRERADYEEHYMHLTQFFEYVKTEYRKVEKEVGMPLDDILS